jgi:hypothetical protein
VTGARKGAGAHQREARRVFPIFPGRRVNPAGRFGWASQRTVRLRMILN